jgi:hypothetical protein
VDFFDVVKNGMLVITLVMSVGLLLNRYSDENEKD